MKATKVKVVWVNEDGTTDYENYDLDAEVNVSEVVVYNHVDSAEGD